MIKDSEYSDFFFENLDRKEKMKDLRTPHERKIVKRMKITNRP